MANEEHLAILRQGVEAWNKWRRENPESIPDLISANFMGWVLAGVDLSNARLSAANFGQANLSEAYLAAAALNGANFTRATLFRADLSGANLRRAILVEAFLYDADLSEADLQGADFREANCSVVNLSGAILHGADFTEATFGWTKLGAVDIRLAKGLETARHEGPSTIGIDTIFASKGNIPEEFLEGAGVPEPFITNMKALVSAMDPIQFYSCFISYSTKDQEFAARLYADLQANNVRCWFAPHDIQAGKKLHDQIDEAIRLHDRLLLILSEYSMGSEWVKTEIAKARKREVRDGARVLFPIALFRSKLSATGNASMPTPERIRHARSASILFLTSATGRTTTTTRLHSIACFEI